MKFSYHWIKDYVDGLDTDARELAHLITMKTAECEGIEAVGEPLREAQAALILAVEPIAGSHNLKALIETAEGTKWVVCGAPNCWAGMHTAWLPVGRKMIDGIESDGMLASGAELGITRDHSGIVKLASPELTLTPDTVFEIDNKSLTHRPDLWGHHGMAREVAAITGRQLREPADLSLVPTDKPRRQRRDRRPRPLSAIQRAGVRQRHRAAFAALAAIPPRIDRPELDQQHRRRDQLRDGRPSRSPCTPSTRRS